MKTSTRLSIVTTAAALLLISAPTLAVPYHTAAASPQAAPTERPCSGSFEADIIHGPDADFSLVGRLFVMVQPSGTIKGLLVRPSSEPSVRTLTIARVSGNMLGRLLRLALVTLHGKRIVGTGAADVFARCRGKVRGNLSAPGGDSGVWASIDSPPIIISAPSFYEEVCNGATDGALAVYRDGRVYSCGMKAFLVFPE